MIPGEADVVGAPYVELNSDLDSARAFQTFFTAPETAAEFPFVEIGAGSEEPVLEADAEAEEEEGEDSLLI